MQNVKGNTKFGKLLYKNNKAYKLTNFFEWMIDTNNVKEFHYNNGSIVFHAPDSAQDHSGTVEFEEDRSGRYYFFGGFKRSQLLRNGIQELNNWCDGRPYGKLSYSKCDNRDAFFNIASVPGEFNRTIWFETTEPLNDLYKQYLSAANERSPYQSMEIIW